MDIKYSLIPLLAAGVLAAATGEESGRENSGSEQRKEGMFDVHS